MSAVPSERPDATRPRAGDAWKLRQPLRLRTIAVALVACMLLAVSAHHTQMPHLLALTAEWIESAVGLKPSSQIGRGLGRYARNALPLAIAEETPIARIEHFDRNKLPLLSHLEMRKTTSARYDFEAKRMVETEETEEVLVEPVGYLVYVLGKMLVSLEIALWGSIVALALGVPLAYLGARGYAPHPIVYFASRMITSFMRAVPELVSALVLTLAFDFGPIAGVLALGFHAAGFFGKFYADDVENADKAPQEALFAVGASRLKVLRYAVLPQVLPQYVAYTQYILERNVRMATVIGVVGAGGIGIELKGRFDMFEFNRVSTILLVIFCTVLVLEQLSQAVRRRLIAPE
jgi:phosphonate transport system permease protein